MSSPKIQAHGQIVGHVTSPPMLYFLKKKTLYKPDLATLIA